MYKLYAFHPFSASGKKKLSGGDVSSALSPGQTDSQVLASSGKLNLRRDLRWMAKRTAKFPRKCTKVAKKKSYFKATGSVTELALTWVGWPNGKKLALTCGQI